MESTYRAPLIRTEGVDTTKFLLSPEDLINQFEHAYLRGEREVFDETVGKNVWRNDNEKCAKMNEKGIRELRFYIHSVLNKNTFMGNLDEEEVYNLSRFATRGLWRDLHIHAQTYNLDTKEIPQILETVSTIFLLSLSRAKYASLPQSDKNLLQTTRHEQEVVQHSTEQTTGGGGGIFGIFRRAPSQQPPVR